MTAFVCVIARPAIGVARLIQMLALTEVAETTIGATTRRAKIRMTAPAVRRRITPTPRLNNAITARKSAPPTTAWSTAGPVSDGVAKAGGPKPFFRWNGWARENADTLALRPATKTAPAGTTALAARTPPRRGLTVNAWPIGRGV